MATHASFYAPVSDFHQMPDGSRFFFRGEVPTYAPPSKEEWQAKYHVTPFVIETRSFYVTRAKLAIELDRESLTFDKAIEAHERLLQVCMSAWADAVRAGQIKEDDSVFFDPAGNQFWAYPTTPPPIQQ